MKLVNKPKAQRHSVPDLILTYPYLTYSYLFVNNTAQSKNGLCNM